MNFERHDRAQLDYLIASLTPHTLVQTLRVVYLALECSYKGGELVKTDRENLAVPSDISDLFFRAGALALP